MTDIVERLESVEFMGMPDGVLDYSTASEAAARIKALEARIAKADALADEMERLVRRTPFVPAMNGIAVTITVDQIADQKAALAAYQATKEQSK